MSDQQDPMLIVEEVVETGELKRMQGISRRNDGFSRADVIDAFHNAFRIIGGVPRLAMWANDNPDKFYPLYAKLLPSTAITIGTQGAVTIEHAIARSALDDHRDAAISAIEMSEPTRLPEQ